MRSFTPTSILVRCPDPRSPLSTRFPLSDPAHRVRCRTDRLPSSAYGFRLRRYRNYLLIFGSFSDCSRSGLFGVLFAGWLRVLICGNSNCTTTEKCAGLILKTVPQPTLSAIEQLVAPPCYVVPYALPSVP